MKYLITVILFFAYSLVNGQSVSISIDGTGPNSSAMLDIKNENKGLLIPRVALVDALDVATIPNPAASLLIYNTATGGVGRFAVSPGFYFWNNVSLQWICLTVSDNSVKGAWILGGNVGTSTINNFFGTTDNQALLFKINNQNAGYLGLAGNAFWGLKSGDINTSGYSNVAIGNSALNKNTNRSNLVAVGDSALFNNGIGATTLAQSIDNTAIGSKALYTNNLGSYNTAIGYNALLANTSGTQNTATGVDALHFNSTGILNAAHGINALFMNTSGSYNTASGANTLVKNTTGINNTATGYSALFNNSTGNNNTAVGVSALEANTTGVFNTATGTSALLHNTTGASNTSAGMNALLMNTTGNSNTATGYLALSLNNANFNTAHGASALENNSTGTLNSAVGSRALISNTTGNNNTATGANCLFANTIGVGNSGYGTNTLNTNTSGNYNTGNGGGALLSHNTGDGNTATGFSALFSDVSGEGNTSIGAQSLTGNISGNNNTAIGYFSMTVNSTGSNNTALGYNSNLGGAALTNATVIGANTTVSTSNKIRLGNSSVTVIEGAVAYSFPSDKRFKYNIKKNVPGLDFINKLTPVTYYFDDKKLDEYSKTGILNNDVHAASYTGAGELHTGFLAQDVEKIAKDLGYSFDGVHIPVNDKDHYSLAYSQFIMPLVKAMQEQQILIEKLTKQVAGITTSENQQLLITAQNKRIEKLEQQLHLLLKNKINSTP